MNRWKTSLSSSQVLLLSFAALGFGCQKQAAATACGSGVAGASASASNEAGANNAGSPASAGSAGSGATLATGGSGGQGSAGGANAGNDGTGAAAATGGGAGTGGIGGAAPDSTACAQLTLLECSTNADCQGLSGQRISGDPKCLGPFAVVACGTKLGCSPVATRATDLTGHDWIFPSTCIPAGWPNSSSSGTRFDACMVAAAGASGMGGASGAANAGAGGS